MKVMADNESKQWIPQCPASLMGNGSMKFNGNMHFCKIISSTFLTQGFFPDDSFKVSYVFCGEFLGCSGELRSAIERTVMSYDVCDLWLGFELQVINQ